MKSEIKAKLSKKAKIKMCRHYDYVETHVNEKAIERLRRKPFQKPDKY